MSRFLEFLEIGIIFCKAIQTRKSPFSQIESQYFPRTIFVNQQRGDDKTRGFSDGAESGLQWKSHINCTENNPKKCQGCRYHYQVRKPDYLDKPQSHLRIQSLIQMDWISSYWRSSPEPSTTRGPKAEAERRESIIFKVRIMNMKPAL